MNTVREQPAADDLRMVCSTLSFWHAVLVTGGLATTWAIRCFPAHAAFASSLEIYWACALALWPLWWAICLVLARKNIRHAAKSLLPATCIWLLAAIPTALLLYSLRWYFGFG
jgi:hypothetical protein